VRAIALAALIAAALFGSWTRWESRPHTRSGASVARSLDALAGLRLHDGAVVEEVSSRPTNGVRLRLEKCSIPAFLFLIPIESGSAAEVVDRSFASSGYKMVDVYRGEIQQEWHSVNRVIDYVKTSVGAFGRSNTKDNQIYARIYTGANCHVEERVLIDWASTAIAHWQ
jgi:hypothetical protein